MFIVYFEVHQFWMMHPILGPALVVWAVVLGIAGYWWEDNVVSRRRGRRR